MIWTEVRHVAATADMYHAKVWLAEHFGVARCMHVQLVATLKLCETYCLDRLPQEDSTHAWLEVITSTVVNFPDTSTESLWLVTVLH